MPTRIFIYYQFLLKDGLRKRLEILYKAVPNKKHMYINTQRHKQKLYTKQNKVQLQRTKPLIAKKETA